METAFELFVHEPIWQESNWKTVYVKSCIEWTKSEEHCVGKISDKPTNKSLLYLIILSN